jgi:hypothetical protein
MIATEIGLLFVNLIIPCQVCRRRKWAYITQTLLQSASGMDAFYLFSSPGSLRDDLVRMALCGTGVFNHLALESSSEMGRALGLTSNEDAQAA